MLTAPDHPPTPGLILAGGRARRMGGADKALLRLDGRPILSHLVERLESQCDGLLLSANSDPARFAAYGLVVVPDTIPDFAGPLAGILAGLDWLAMHRTNPEWLLSVAADTPFIPLDLVSRLHLARAEAGTRLACAASDGRRHHAIGLWPISLRDELRAALGAGERRLGAFTASYGAALAEWPANPVDPFFNVNTPDDLIAAEAAWRA